MNEKQEKISMAAAALISAMDGLPGCFLRPHRMVTGGRGFRLLDEKLNALGTYRYPIVVMCVELNYVYAVPDGNFYIYKRTARRLHEKAKLL